MQAIYFENLFILRFSVNYQLDTETNKYNNCVPGVLRKVHNPLSFKYGENGKQWRGKQHNHKYILEKIPLQTHTQPTKLLTQTAEFPLLII